MTSNNPSAKYALGQRVVWRPEYEPRAYVARITCNSRQGVYHVRCDLPHSGGVHNAIARENELRAHDDGDCGLGPLIKPEDNPDADRWGDPDHDPHAPLCRKMMDWGD